MPKLTVTINPAVLVVLRELGKVDGALTALEIGQRIGHAHSGSVQQYLGYVDVEKRKKLEALNKRKGLITLGLAEDIVVDVDGQKETLYRITDLGRYALQCIDGDSTRSDP